MVHQAGKRLGRGGFTSSDQNLWMVFGGVT